MQELLHSARISEAANVYWFDAGNNTFWAPKETLIAIRWGAPAQLPAAAWLAPAAPPTLLAAAELDEGCWRPLLLLLLDVAAGCAAARCVLLPALAQLPDPAARPAGAPPRPPARSFILFGWAEANRWQDYIKPGSNVTDPFGNKIKYVELGYPGEWSATLRRCRRCWRSRRAPARRWRQAWVHAGGRPGWAREAGSSRHPVGCRAPDRPPAYARRFAPRTSPTRVQALTPWATPRATLRA